MERMNQALFNAKLAAILVIALLAFAAPPVASAQALSVTLVSNIEQENTESLNPILPTAVGRFSSFNDHNWVHAQSFTTGSNASGYRLTSVALKVDKPDPSAALSIGIYTEDSGEPGRELHRLIGNVENTGVVSFYASSGANLDPNTTYFLVLINDDGEYHYFTLVITNATREDPISQTGFSIGDSRLMKWVSTTDPDPDLNQWGVGLPAVRMSIRGYPIAADDPNTMDPPQIEGVLTAHFQGLPAAHDGQSAFKFAVFFNHDVDVRYQAMRDNVLQVTGGTVVGAERLEPPSSQRWELTLRPNSSRQISIALPAPSDCAAAGAVCTSDGRKLSTPISATVPGPPVPELTVTFRQTDYRVAEGGRVDLPVTLSAVPERQVTIPIEIETVGDTEAIDYSVSPASLTFGASETDKTLRVSASNDSVVDPGESVVLSFGTTLPERISEGAIAESVVAIRDTDFTFAPAFAVGSGTTASDTDTYTVSEDTSAVRLSLSLETPRGVQVVDVVDSVVVTLATRQNAGSKGMDEDYATQRRGGTFGDYGEFERDLSFAPGDFSDDTTCGCARAEKAVAIDIFNDRAHERVEVFGLRLSRRSGRLEVASKDITVKIAEDDAEPVLTLEANPDSIVEAGGTSTVTVSTGSGSTFPAAQTIRLDLSGTATQGTDYTIDATSLTLPAGVGQNPSSVTTTVRAKDDPIDDDSETIAVSATRGGVEFASRTVTVADDEVASTRVDLAVNPAQVREDAGATTVRVTASLNADARGQDTEVTVTVGSSGDSAVEGTDYGTVGDLSLTIRAGETTAETTFSLNPTNDTSVDGAKTITVNGSASGLAVRSIGLTLNDDDVASTTVTLTLDPREVSERAGSRTVRVTGTLDGTARATETVVAVTVGSGVDSAVEGTDYADVPELELTIAANRTDGTVTFNLRPTNDRTAEGTETISVSGNVAGLTVTPTGLAIADDDSPSTRLDLSLNLSTVSEAAAPTDVVVTGSLNAGARTSDSVVTVTVGAATDTATDGVDYANVSTLEITVPANATTGQAMFTLSPDDDAIAEGAETISVTGQVSGLTVEPATLTLSDNDTASRVVMLSVDPESVSEDTPEDVTVTASLNAGARAGDTGGAANRGCGARHGGAGYGL